ncbi:hypothetical protein MTO96_047994 [Rhipicephalus appendiculatus]
MKIKFDFTRRQEQPLIVGFQAEGQKYVELQEDTSTPSFLETIAHIAGATVDGLVAQGSVFVNMTLDDLASHLCSGADAQFRVPLLPLQRLRAPTPTPPLYRLTRLQLSPSDAHIDARGHQAYFKCGLQRLHRIHEGSLYHDEVL